MTADSRSIARLNVRTNVVADLNIKADEINFETVAHSGGGGFESSPSFCFFAFQKLLLSCYAINSEEKRM